MYQQSHPASKAFQFWRTQERHCMIRVRSLLSMRYMLLEYSFEPTPYSRAPGTVGSAKIIGLSIEGYSHTRTRNNRFDEREQD